MATLVNNSPEVLPTPKQIRFVNNQGQPPTKRRRITAACLTCRRRKTRCAGEQPTCSTCTKNGHVCLGYSDAVERKKESGGTHGARPDPDEGDYLDDEPDMDRRQSISSKNGIKITETGDEAPMSRRMSESTNQDYCTPAMQLKSETMDWDEQQSQPTPRAENVTRPTSARHPSFSTDDGESPPSRSPTQHHNESHRVPYFRYFGPTAIVPGFKQMVVKVQDRRRSSMSATSPSSGSLHAGMMNNLQPDPELFHVEEPPFYDPSDTGPVHALIKDLVETFFVRLGSNFAFLRREKFTTMVHEKRAEPILVDAVCALAARFSELPVFEKWNEGKLIKSEFGRLYAQRARAATVETFPCPSVAAVQACLLMAYDGFGADQDSALWMYLGIAIRMAVDLGLSKEDGVKYRGPKDPWYNREYGRRVSDEFIMPPPSDEDTPSPQEQKEVEQERIDTFWAVFFLDRVISSGTGRPVTLKDDDFELELPRSSVDPLSGWPDPLSSLIQIIHLYGRVSDVLNHIKSPKDLSKDKLNKLAHMEVELTKLHQKMELRLRFDANNFQAHVKNGQGTTFILLHFWFHALIIVLHQPTIFTREGAVDRKNQLKAHSRELSMSSAKTIADILAFAELLDPKCFIGNPFTSQPIFIAACAFLLESKSAASQPVSRDATPPPEPKNHGFRHANFGMDASASSRHLLLASAASQNYQLCYKALKQMYEYWGGVRYILTVLDQRSEGQQDCETFTTEEYESAKRSRQESALHRFAKQLEYPASPMPDNGPPLAWSLTGTTNSPNSSLTLLFQNPINGSLPIPPNHLSAHHHNHHNHHHHTQPPTSATVAPVSAPTPPGNMIYDPIRQSLPDTTSMFPPAYPQPNTSALRHSVNPSRRVSSSSTQGKSLLRYEGMSSDESGKTPTTPDGALNMTMSAPGSMGVTSTSYTPSSQQSSGYDPSGYPTGASPASSQSQTVGTGSHPTSGNGTAYSSDGGPSNFAQSGSGMASSGYSFGPTGGNLHLLTYDNETDIGQHLTSFESAEMMSWFGEYFPNDVLGLYPGDSNMS
ncbi:fungal-specific transcription factor domain-containing protein [Xylariomycetidae sp. FL2044]|nr:fungal-specific transcription factor domain-containing protein [Xylariomycetidae sp. FL2044]